MNMLFRRVEKSQQQTRKLLGQIESDERAQDEYISGPMQKAEIYGHKQAAYQQLYEEPDMTMPVQLPLVESGDQSKVSSTLEVNLCRRASEEIQLLDSDNSVTKKETTVEVDARESEAFFKELTTAQQ